MNTKLQLSAGMFLILLIGQTIATISYINSVFSNSLSTYFEPISNIHIISEEYHFLLDKIPTILNQTYNMNPTSQNNNNFSNKIEKAFEKLKNNQQSSLYLPEDNLFLLPTPISTSIENFLKNEKFK